MQHRSATARWWLRATWVLAAVAALPVIYFGAYLAFLDSKVYRPAGFDPATRINRFVILPEYHVHGPVIEAALTPAHRIDRHLRRVCWDTIEKADGTKWRNPAPALGEKNSN